MRAVHSIGYGTQYFINGRDKRTYAMVTQAIMRKKHKNKVKTHTKKIFFGQLYEIK